MTHILRTGEDPQTDDDNTDAVPDDEHVSEQSGTTTNEQTGNWQPEDPGPRRAPLYAERIRAAGRRLEEAGGLTHAEWLEARKAEQDERARVFYARRAAHAAVQRRRARRIGLAAFAIVTTAAIGISTPYVLESYAPEILGHISGTQPASMVAANQDQGYSSYYQASPDRKAHDVGRPLAQAEASGNPATNAGTNVKKKPEDLPRISAAGSTVSLASIPLLEPVSAPEPTLENANSAVALSPPVKPEKPRLEEREVAALQPSQQPRTVDLPSPPEPEDDPINPAQAQPLLERGDELMQLGDIISARALYDRALKLDRPRAAQRLGSTFDPLIFNKLGVKGLTPSIELALKWYGTAAESGNHEARLAIESLQRAGVQ
jgi:hypothetical protein